MNWTRCAYAVAVWVCTLLVCMVFFSLLVYTTDRNLSTKFVRCVNEWLLNAVAVWYCEISNGKTSPSRLLLRGFHLHDFFFQFSGFHFSSRWCSRMCESFFFVCFQVRSSTCSVNLCDADLGLEIWFFSFIFSHWQWCSTHYLVRQMFNFSHWIVLSAFELSELFNLFAEDGWSWRNTVNVHCTRMSYVQKHRNYSFGNCDCHQHQQTALEFLSPWPKFHRIQ